MQCVVFAFCVHFKYLFDVALLFASLTSASFTLRNHLHHDCVCDTIRRRSRSSRHRLTCMSSSVDLRLRADSRADLKTARSTTRRISSLVRRISRSRDSSTRRRAWPPSCRASICVSACFHSNVLVSYSTRTLASSPTVSPICRNCIAHLSRERNSKNALAQQDVDVLIAFVCIDVV